MFRSLSQYSAIFRPLLFACPPRVRVGALRVPCAEVSLFEAAGSLVWALQFSRDFPANFAQGFAIGLHAP